MFNLFEKKTYTFFINQKMLIFAIVDLKSPLSHLCDPFLFLFSSRVTTPFCFGGNAISAKGVFLISFLSFSVKCHIFFLHTIIFIRLYSLILENYLNFVLIFASSKTAKFGNEIFGCGTYSRYLPIGWVRGEEGRNFRKGDE